MMAWYNKLWQWFSLSRSSFLVLSRAMMHDMPDEWQGEVADLLDEFDSVYSNQIDIGTTVRIIKNGKLIKMPDFLINYCRPDNEAIRSLKGATNEDN